MPLNDTIFVTLCQQYVVYFFIFVTIYSKFFGVLCILDIDISYFKAEFFIGFSRLEYIS